MPTVPYQDDLAILAPEKGEGWYRVILPHCQADPVEILVNPDTGRVWAGLTPTATFIYSTYLSKEFGEMIEYQHGENAEHRRSFIKAEQAVIGPQLEEWYAEIHRLPLGAI